MQASADNQVEIYIYDEIGYWGVTARQFVNDLKALGDVTHINLHINSPGGDVFDGIAILMLLNIMVRQLPFISTVWPRLWPRSLLW